MENKKKIVGITRIRNEEHIIADTLNHVGKFVDAIYVYDDCSTDNTVKIVKAHPKVKAVIEGKEWASTPKGRQKAEGTLRTAILNRARKDKPEWIYYFDADEFADFEGIDFKADAYKMRLFDFYITPEDKDKSYKERKWIGPEYRDILMLFKDHPDIEFKAREPNLPGDYKVKTAGYVKHYGKAISVEEWEKACDYYIKHRGGDYLKKNFTNKWIKRRGKAIHTKSDLGSELITWDKRKKI